MLKNARPSEFWLGVILRAYDAAKTHQREPVTVSDIWAFACMEGVRERSFETMFLWDESKAQHKNRVKTVAETIADGWVPGLCLARDERGREYVAEVAERASDQQPPAWQDRLL